MQPMLRMLAKASVAGWFATALCACATSTPCQTGSQAECLQYVRGIRADKLPPVPERQPSDSELVALYGEKHVAAWKLARQKYRQCTSSDSTPPQDQASLSKGSLTVSSPSSQKMLDQFATARRDNVTSRCGKPPPPVDSTLYDES